MALLEVKNLCSSFFTDEGEVRAVRGISFSLERGQTLGLVGESGCGKSVTALSILRLLPFPGKIVSGDVIFNASKLTELPDKEMQKVRGGDISMIFQEPLTSLNPVFTIGEQIEEAILLHQKTNKKEARKRAIESLKSVGIPSPESRVKNYPHQLSGGMRQRAMIAMALSCNPKLLIADEPTTALDVTIQAQIIDLLAELQAKKQMSLILITHDLGVVSQVVNRIAIMYAGKIVEYAYVEDLLGEPQHPYTKGLLASIPGKNKDKSEPLDAIKGSVPSLLNLPKGCAFADRCIRVQDKCRMVDPELREVKEKHWCACHYVSVKLPERQSVKEGE